MTRSRQFSNLTLFRSIAVGGVSILGLLGCNNDQGFTERRRVDVFRQERRNSVDVLLVVDNSCSMAEEQDNLASNFQSLIDIFEPADVDWQIAVTTTDVESEAFRGLLLGGDDEIIVRGSGGELDRVAYDRNWIFNAGVSLQLDAARYTWNGNDGLDAWCASDIEYVAGSTGSPGAWNVGCTGDSITPPSGGTPGSARAPQVGDLVVTEIMARSAGLDSKCEWFELTNTSDETIDLSGVELTDLGRNRVVFSEGAVANPYQAMVIGRSLDPEQNCGVPVDVAVENGFTLNHDQRTIDRDTPDGAELFSELVAQGTTGAGIEMGLEASRLVFEPEYADKNPKFLRDEADFSVLYVSDENDLSPYPVDAYVRYLTDLKGDRAYRNRDVVNLSAVVGRDIPVSSNQPSCQSASGYAGYGERYVVAANQTQGLVESICEEDFAPIISELGLTLSGLSAEFELSDWPQLQTLEAALYASDNEDEKIRDLIAGTDFSYFAQENRIRFEQSQLPPSETWIVLKYELSARPNTEDIGVTP